MKRLFLVVLMISFVSVFGCDVEESTQSKGAKKQESIMQRAIKSVPTPEVNNFLTRKTVARWMERMDVPSKIFYVYVMTDMGAPVGYFTAQYKPVSTATFLTPTKREYKVMGSGPNPLGPSPALDGTYYGSGGNSSQYFWFDAETDALIELKDLAYIMSDQPLSLDVPRIHVEAKGGK